MKITMPGAMREATRLTSSGDLVGATAAIQQMLGQAMFGDQLLAAGAVSPSNASTNIFSGVTIDGVVDPAASTDHKKGPGAHDGAGHFTTHSFSNQAGSRPYMLYVPSGYHGQDVPLVVMLHGCTQSPEDFAEGTQMNTLAERETFIVAYPGQVRSANMQGCWNWFSSADQQRGVGEPSLIAGITGRVMADYAIDSRRVFVAGLSAGGAEAAIMGAAYPDIFAAIGVHSGLACGSASDIASAMAAMKSGSAGTVRPASHRIVPTIIFHGDRDMTVNRKNADAIANQAAMGATLTTEIVEGKTPGGHAHRLTIRRNANKVTIVEQWTVNNGGHAWFGGSASGTYTDPRGPNASAEMLRFFQEHPLNT